MTIVACINGTLFPEHEARVPVLDRGFLYGDSVFEVLRTYGGRPFAEREHLARLAASCDRLLITLPAPLETLSRDIATTLDAAQNAESYIRVVITRGTGPVGYDPTLAVDPLRVVLVTPLQSPPEALFEKGASIALLRASRPSDDSRATGAKTSNYLASILAGHEARQRGAYEAVLISPTGEILEGTTSNVFLVRDGSIRTPRPEAGILVGITRQLLLELAAREGIEVRQEALFPRDLYDADEVFITSTLKEVLPVVAADGQIIGTGQPGPVTVRLLRAFREEASRRCRAS